MGNVGRMFFSFWARRRFSRLDAGNKSSLILHQNRFMQPMISQSCASPLFVFRTVLAFPSLSMSLAGSARIAEMAPRRKSAPPAMPNGEAMDDQSSELTLSQPSEAAVPAKRRSGAKAKSKAKAKASSSKGDEKCEDAQAHNYRHYIAVLPVSVCILTLSIRAHAHVDAHADAHTCTRTHTIL